MSYSADVFVADEQPTTTKWNKLWSNDASFNDGSGIANGVLGSYPGIIDADATDVGFYEIGRTTLGSAGDTISVASLPAKKYLKIMIIFATVTDVVNSQIRFNNDSSTNYAYSIDELDDTAIVSGTGTSEIPLESGNRSVGGYIYTTLDVLNVSSWIKGVHGVSHGWASASNPEYVSGLWDNTSTQINRVDVTNNGAGSFDTGSEIVVMGKD